MSSGVSVDSAVISLYEEMKLRKSHAFIVLRISKDGTQVVVEKTFAASEAARIGSEATYDAFTAALPKDEARYGIIDLEYQNGLEGVRSKLIFVSWNPNDGKIRSRMLYASSKNGLRQRLDGIHTEVQCTDAEELSFESVFAQIAPKGATPVVKAGAPAEE